MHHDVFKQWNTNYVARLHGSADRQYDESQNLTRAQIQMYILQPDIINQNQQSHNF